MALQTNGPISILDLRQEFNDSGSSSLSEFYRGGALVPAFINTYQPSATTYNFSLVSPLYGWVQDQSFPYTVELFWNNVSLVTFNSSFGTPTSHVHTDGWTYVKDTNTSYPNINTGSATVTVWPIRRQQATSINQGVPESGQISLGDFYGATND